MTRVHSSYYIPNHDTKHAINMINHILINLQVEIINSRHESSYNIISIMNPLMIYGRYNVI